MPQEVNFHDMYVNGVDRMVANLAESYAIRPLPPTARVAIGHDALLRAGFEEHELRAMLAITLDRLATNTLPTKGNPS